MSDKARRGVPPLHGRQGGGFASKPPCKNLGLGVCPSKIVPVWVKIDRHFRQAVFLQYCTLFCKNSHFGDKKCGLRGQMMCNFLPSQVGIFVEKKRIERKKCAIL